MGGLLVLTLSILGADAQTHPQFVDVVRKHLRIPGHLSV